MKKINRRESLKQMIGLGGMMGLIPLTSRALMCKEMARQPEGPFYPNKGQEDEDNDLTFVHGKEGRAKGEVIEISGQVLDIHCDPVENALVEIWQANRAGAYNHSADPNFDPSNPSFDKNFQYWGKDITDSNGHYRFKTIKPGSYPANTNWVRPPHIHWKIQKRGYEELILQTYFSEEVELNRKDLILQNLSEEQQKRVILNFNESHDNESKKANFNITVLYPHLN